MRNFIALLGILILAQSCTIALPSIANQTARENGNAYTHSEYMNKITTKRQVIQKFGSPTTQKSIEGIEIWYYDKGTSAYATSYSTSTEVNSYDKYVEFQFAADKVINWRTKGVNYGKVAPSSGVNMIFGLLIDCGLGIYGTCWAVRNDPYLACW